MNNAKKKKRERERKIIEWKRLEIFPQNWRNQGNIPCKDGYEKGQKLYGPSSAQLLGYVGLFVTP